MSLKTSIKKISNSVSNDLLKTSEPKPSNKTTEKSPSEVEDLKSGESLVKVFNFLPPTNPSELKKLKGFWEAMKAVNVKPQRGAPLPVPKVSKKVLSEHVSQDVRKEPIMSHVGSFEYQEIVRLNEWKGQQQRDREKQAALRAILPPPCCCKTCGLRPVDCECPAEEVPLSLIPSTTPDLLTCHLDCVCDEGDDLQSVQGFGNLNNHNISIGGTVDSLEEEQCDCNPELTPNKGATSVKEECDCKPFCRCNSDSGKLKETFNNNNNNKKFCECSTICYCDNKGSFCLCCYCNRIGSSFANPELFDNISSGMKLSQCGCESLCECGNGADGFSVDYMKELEELREKTDEVYESSCKLEELKETFRQSGSLSEPWDFFRKSKSDKQVDEVEEKSSFDRFVEETLVKFRLPACECSHSDCDCQNGSVKKVEAENSCDCEISSTCKCEEDPVFKKPPVLDRACGRDSESATLPSKAVMCFVCGHFGCGCQDDESESNTRRKFYVQDFGRQKMSWKGDYEGLDACFIEVSEIVDNGEGVQPSSNGEKTVQVTRISVGCNTTEGEDKCF